MGFKLKKLTLVYLKSESDARYEALVEVAATGPKLPADADAAGYKAESKVGRRYLPLVIRISISSH